MVVLHKGPLIKIMGCGKSKLRTEKYARRYTAASVVTSSAETQSMYRSKDGDCKFFSQARAKLARDYVLIIDRSGSMEGTSWEEAKKSVEFFAESICDFDPDGITLIMFDHEVIKFDNVKDASFIRRTFSEVQPRGTTDLAKALDAAFLEHFGGTRGATTILVITDGCPDSEPEVERVIQKAANSITSDEELSISFVQIGDDEEARRFLKFLDDDLDANFDVVDVVFPKDLQEMSFADVIRKSMCD
jgi:Mg-chelatase subunit ChlD